MPPEVRPPFVPRLLSSLRKAGVSVAGRVLRLVLAAVVTPGFAATYYVDSSGGSDANVGTATNAAWQTLAKINATTFQPGDYILLKNGGSWTGTLNPQGSGATNNPIVIGCYGTNSAPPLINGNGATDAVLLNNQQYWEINNLEVINPGSGASTERRGIHLTAADFGVVNHLYVSNCYVHNVVGRVDTSNGDLVAKRTGGIVVEVTGDSTTPSRFNDIVIQNCTITAVTNQGIVACANRTTTSAFPGASSWKKNHCSNVIIRNNVISGVCKNAMSFRYGDESCLVEHNLFHDTANTTDGNQVCSYSTRGTVFQFNEGYHNNGDGAADGSMYDADLNSPLTVWQYSYSHDNTWGLWVDYDGGTDTNVVVRYNISQNDQQQIFHFSGTASATVSLYNNTIYVPANLGPVFFDSASSGHTYYVYNNVFYNLSSASQFFSGSGNTHFFDYNVYFNQHPGDEPSEAHKLTSDPLLVAPGTGGGAGGTNNMATLGGYKLQAGSPCIDSGTNVTTTMTGNPNAGGLEFFGDQVPNIGQPDRGAAEWYAAVSSNQPPTIVLQTGSNSVLPNSVALVADVNPGGIIADCYYAYGLTANYGSFSGTNIIAAGTNALTVTNLISGLLPGTLYHYRAYVTNGAGGANSPDTTVATTAITAPVLGAMSVDTNGIFQCAFTSAPGAVFEMLAATNVSLPRSNWTVVGTLTENPPGQFKFVDDESSTNEPQEFYQIRSP